MVSTSGPEAIFIGELTDSQSVVVVCRIADVKGSYFTQGECNSVISAIFPHYC